MLRLLQVTGTLDPEYGGPPVVLNQLTRSLLRIGHSVDVATLDSPSDPWLSDVPGNVLTFGPCRGRYGYARHLRRWLYDKVAEYDAVVAHGIWQYQSRAVRQACVPRGVPFHVFVHGALDPWFQQRYPLKHLKKSVYWRLAEAKNLRNASSVIFTEDQERALARTSFQPYEMNDIVIKLGIDEPAGDPLDQRRSFLNDFPSLNGKRVLLFMSRLHPKKGCDLLIEAFSRVAHMDDDLHLVIAGPDEVGLRPELEALCRKLSLDGRVTFTGMIFGDVKWGAYHSADVFVLISHSENFGIVIAEALACGVPVLTTDKVNIWREIAESGGGIIGEDTVDSAEALMSAWLHKSSSDRDEMRVLARNCYSTNFSARNFAEQFLRTALQVAEK